MTLPKPSFFKLTNDIWLAAIHELSVPDLKILFHLLTLKPLHDNWFQITTKDIAIATGLHRTTVTRALKRLSEKGCINLEITTAWVRITQKGKNLGVPACTHDASLHSGCQPAHIDASQHSEMPDGTLGCQRAFSDAGKNHGESVSEPLRLIRLRRLKKKERETRTREESFPQDEAITPEYREWLLKKANELPNRPALLESWVRKQAAKPDVIAEYEAWCSRQNVPPPPASPQFLDHPFPINN